MKRIRCPGCKKSLPRIYFVYMGKLHDKCSSCRVNRPPHPGTVYLKRRPGRRKTEWRSRARVKAQ